MRVQRSVPTLSKTTEVLPILNSQHHWRQKEEAAHIPSGMWCPLLCLLKFCGWEGKQFVGLADIFSFMQMHHCWKTLSASHYIWNSQRQGPCLPSLLCMMPNILWMVNKCHIVFILHWLRMTFSHESCLLQFLSKSHKVYTFPRKKTLFKASIPCLSLFSKFPWMHHSPFPWAMDCYPSVLLFFHSHLQNLHVNIWHPISCHLHHNSGPLFYIYYHSLGEAFDKAYQLCYY